jgi:hypothetical protein
MFVSMMVKAVNYPCKLLGKVMWVENLERIWIFPNIFDGGAGILIDRGKIET